MKWEEEILKDEVRITEGKSLAEYEKGLRILGHRRPMWKYICVGAHFYLFIRPPLQTQ